MIIMFMMSEVFFVRENAGGHFQVKSSDRLIRSWEDNSF